MGKERATKLKIFAAREVKEMACLSSEQQDFKMGKHHLWDNTWRYFDDHNKLFEMIIHIKLSF